MPAGKKMKRQKTTRPMMVVLRVRFSSCMMSSAILPQGQPGDHPDLGFSQAINLFVKGHRSRPGAGFRLVLFLCLECAVLKSVPCHAHDKVDAV